MRIIIENLDKEFLEALDFLKNREKFLIDLDKLKIILTSNSISKARAVTNLIFRLIRIYEDLGRTLSKL
ncbi:MAG: hypothetical protein QW038_01110 [Nanopusillaceae archaeon]